LNKTVRVAQSPTRRRLSASKLALALTAAIILAIGCFVFADYWIALPADASATFVGRSACIDCHREQSEAFAGSHHDKAMELATDASVLGDFNDATIEHDGIVSRMYRNGTRFMIHTEGETGAMEDFEIKYVFGVEPLQQYMVEFDRDAAMAEHEIPRVQVLRISWDTYKKEWFYLRPPDVTDKLSPDDPLHWTGIAQRWQTMCADCHSTNLKTNFDVKTARYHTTFSEINVSCEACHGPGSLHVELAQNRKLFWDRRHGYGLAALKGDDPEPQLQTCAPCHSRRGVLDDQFVAGQKFHDFFNLELLQPDTYYADGQIKDEVYEFGSFTQSKMYHKGIRCSDCHDPHSLTLKHQGNETCTSCHQHPAGKYDVPSHHHHAVGSEAALCVNCHMPGRTYMDVDFRRDHSLRVPRPDLSVQWGTPNACSSCHVNDLIEKVPEQQRGTLREYADWLNAAEAGDQQIAGLIEQTDQWCDEAYQQWYGPNDQRPRHYGEAIAAFRAGDPDGVKQMLALALQRDDLTPAIARATALDNLAAYGDAEVAQAGVQVLSDTSEHPLVRAAAARTLASLSPAAAKRILMPRLRGESPLVRYEITQMLAQARIYQSLSAGERTQVDLALREVESTLMITADRAGAHMAWAALCEQRGRIPEAIAAYENALRVEPNMAGPRTNLAALLDQAADRGDNRARQRSEQLRSDELPLLARDAKLAPQNPVVQYRYGLALYLSGNLDEAMRQLELTVELAPEVEDYKLALRLLREKLQETP
jgi:tetratricopeptide (TPR) repeat protein